MAEANALAGLHEPERELRRRAHALVVEAVAGRDRRCGKCLDRLRVQQELAAAAGEHAVGFGDAASGADAAPGRSLQVAHDRVIGIEVERRTRIRDQRSVEHRAPFSA
jgi:hypothetical protein